MATPIEFTGFRALHSNVNSLVYDHFLTELQRNYPKMPVYEAVTKALVMSKGMTICQTCGGVCVSNSQFPGYCSASCYRDSLN